MTWRRRGRGRGERVLRGGMLRGRCAALPQPPRLGGRERKWSGSGQRECDEWASEGSCEVTIQLAPGFSPPSYSSPPGGAPAGSGTSLQTTGAVASPNLPTICQAAEAVHRTNAQKQCTEAVQQWAPTWPHPLQWNDATGIHLHLACAAVAAQAAGHSERGSWRLSCVRAPVWNRRSAVPTCCYGYVLLPGAAANRQAPEGQGSLGRRAKRPGPLARLRHSSHSRLCRLGRRLLRGSRGRGPRLQHLGVGAAGGLERAGLLQRCRRTGVLQQQSSSGACSAPSCSAGPRSCWRLNFRPRQNHPGGSRGAARIMLPLAGRGTPSLAGWRRALPAS